MMPVPFPYGNQPVFGPNMHPNYPFNYNPYYSTFCPNPNGLLPAPPPPPPRPLMAPPIANKPNVNLREPPRPLLSFGRNDFMSFIEQKTKPISELNPFANEFSTNNQNIPIPKETNSSYQLIFDNLIEQSLQSIDAIKKASKYSDSLSPQSIFHYLSSSELFLLIMFRHNTINQLSRSIVPPKHLITMLNINYFMHILYILYVENFPSRIGEN